MDDSEELYDQSSNHSSPTLHTPGYIYNNWYNYRGNTF